MQSLSELTGNQIAARADEYDAGKEDGDDDADASEDGIITCKASVSRINSLFGMTHNPKWSLKTSH